MSTNPPNMPTITFYNSLISTIEPIPVTPTNVNPLVPSGGALIQPPNWHYYLITTTGVDTYDMKVNIVAAAGYTLPPISFMFTGSGGKGGAGSGCGGGGGGSGGVALINNYFSGVNSTWHDMKLYPLGGYNSVLYLDDGVNNNNVFYAYTGGGGGNASTSESANGGNGGTGVLVYPPVNALPTFCPIIRGGAGGNKGQPNGTDNKNKPGASFNGYVNPSGSSLGGNDPPANVPVTFADGLTTTLLYGGKGGLLGPASTPGLGGTAGQSGAPSMFMLYFCL